MMRRKAGALKTRKCRNVFLYFSALAVNLPTFELGYLYAWSAVVLPKLNGQADSQSNPLRQPITLEEESWIASLAPLGAAVSCFIAGYLSDKVGRKKTLLLFSVPRTVGYLLNGFATDVVHFYLGRFFSGLGCGVAFIVTPVYIGEIAEVSNRGLLGCFFMIFVSLGNLYVFTVGPYTSVKIVGLSPLVPAVIFVLIYGFTVPESPYYLMGAGDLDGAERSLRRLRCNDEEVVKEEIPGILRNVEDSFAKRTGVKDLFRDRGVFKGICITSGLVVFQQLSGVNFIFFYMKSMFEETASVIPANASVIMVGVAQLVAAIATSSLVDKLGRRPLLLASASGNVIALLSFAAYFFVKETGQSADIFWLPTASIILFLLTYTIGFGALPYTILGELFPPHIKSVAATLTIFLCLALTFCVTVFFPHLVTFIGIAYAYCLLAIFCCIAGVFVYVCVPETKGKSLQEIQDMLKTQVLEK